ncbi:hypothetical protein LWI29_020246 [Acer saccharum]|uniref:Uncharacterized protein n=1 Tax=Acer saccharum TaxID=4024 RepID=A0AA39VJL6_ACESA|nr:hypothetical protein LWI29_020246 [Acer saccharum]
MVEVSAHSPVHRTVVVLRTLTAVLAVFRCEMESALKGRENDCGPYHTKFNLKQLLLIDESICMTNRVLIYPSCRDGQPPALKCPIDPVGYIICYSL